MGEQRRLHSLHLFAGAGGGILADLLLGHVPVCAVEIDPYCQRVLMQRQADGFLPYFPIWDDIRTFDGKPWRGHVDLVAGGFPCQPWSLAGARKGHTDNRNLWPDTYRVVCAIRPRYVFLENVPGLLAHPYFGCILGALAEAGYDARWCVLGADDIGAPHRRKRLWLLATNAHSASGGMEPGRGQWARGATSASVPGAHGTSQSLADASSIRCLRHTTQPTGGCPSLEDTDSGGLPGSSLCTKQQGRTQALGASENDSPVGNAHSSSTHALSSPSGSRRTISESGWWLTEPDVGRVAHGVAARVDRLRALGNGQVPLCAAMAWRILIEGLTT